MDSSFTRLGIIIFLIPFLYITLSYLKSKLVTPFYIQCKIQVRLKTEKNDWKEEKLSLKHILLHALLYALVLLNNVFLIL